MEAYDIQSAEDTAEDIQDALKDLLGGTIKEMMETESPEKRISKRYSSIKGTVSCHIWSYEEMDQYDPQLGTGVWWTEYYVRRTPPRVTNKQANKTGGKPPALDMPFNNCYI